MASIRLINRILWIAFVSLMVFHHDAGAQVGFSFGQNKVQYKNFDWSILRTPNFDVYYYSEKKEAAVDAARMAERGYAYLSEILDHQITERIPLILYSSMNDFQQTNVIQGMIGDGTRGVAESLKGRIIMPITGSYREFNHVLVHELVHAFQFDMMSTYKGESRFNPPLWFVEGMAEYLSNIMDNSTRMWIRDGLINDNLLTIAQLNSTYDIRVYRLGQAFWYYIGETYGKEKVGQIFKSAVTTGNIDEAFQSVLNLDSKELTQSWHEAMKSLAKNESVEFQSADSLATPLVAQRNFFHRVNIAPAISPDGNKVAYIANKNLTDEIYLMTKNEDGSWSDRLLISGGRSNQFESIRFFSSAMDWSADSRLLTFATKSGRNDVLYVMDADSREIIKQFRFDQLAEIQSPTFSPDMDRIAFSGQSGGWSNLYVVKLSSGQIKQLTDDRHSVLHPRWSPDGRFIALATDRGSDTIKDQLLFGDHDLALYDLETGHIEMITELHGHVTNPQWSADGKRIAFISDHQGIPNIYALDLDSRNITSLSRFKSGVSGITENTPAFSWSTTANQMVFTTFKNQGWQIYQMEISQREVISTTPVFAGIDTTKSPNDSSAHVINITSIEENWLPVTRNTNTIFNDYTLAPMDSIEFRKFSNRFRLDGLLAGAGLGGFFGSYGGAQLFFSDILGNHNLFVSSSIQFSDFNSADFGAAYFNQSRRLNYGLQVFQTSSAYAAFSTRNSLGLLRQTYRGINGIAAYPFSRFARLEFGAGWTTVDQDILIDTFNGRRFNRDTRDLNILHFAQFGLAYVYDNTLYGPLGPLNGNRYRFSVQQAVNDLEFRTYFADYRRYFNINFRSVLAWRLVGGLSTGPYAQVFRLGGPYSFRGTDYDGLVGTNMLLQNLEYRFPLLFFLPPTADFLSGFTFFDTGAAWGINIPGYAKESFQPFTAKDGFRLNDLRSALGLGARLNLGFFVLEYYQAWPTDFKRFDNSIGKFSIGTFF